MRAFHALSALILGIGLAACAPPTPAPTVTPTVTSTPAVVVEVTHFPTTMAPPTFTLTPSPTVTNTPTNTPTGTFAPPTIAPTIGPTPTVLITALPGTLIRSFSADPTEINPGENFTLAWKTVANTVVLWSLLPTGQLGSWEDVPAEGSKQIATDPSVRNAVRYMLYARSGNTTESQFVTVSVRCPDTWFMSNPPAACPASSALVTKGVYQTFFNGLMIWLEGNHMITVLYNDGNSPQWDMFSDPWNSSMPESDPSLVPPAGAYQPVRGFGKIWREQPGVRARLDWAIQPEIVFSSAYQCDSPPKYTTCFIQGPTGVIVLKPERSGWSLWNGPTPSP